MRLTRTVTTALLLASLGAGPLSCADDGVDPLPAADAAVAADAGPGDAGRADAGGAPDAGGTPDAGLGEPITAPPMEWTWVDVPEARCLNDTPTGFGVNINPASDKLLIFMMGGNACFNNLSCSVTANTDGYGPTKFDNDKGMISRGSFDRAAPENHFRDWSYVFLPYCSGDVFSGTAPQAEVEGTRYKFVGYRNVGYFLGRILPTFPQVTQVALVGVSAGGFGALFNFDRVQSAFGPGVRVTLIDDSGPPMASQFFAPCLQRHFRTLWQFDVGPLGRCDGCADTTDGSFVEGYMSYLLASHPGRNFALISSDQDQVIRGFWGFGNEDCRYLFGVLGVPGYPGATYRAGLEDLRDRLLGGVDNFGLYMPTSTRHVWLDGAPWMVNENGVVLEDWLVQALEDDPGWRSAP